LAESKKKKFASAMRNILGLVKKQCIFWSLFFALTLFFIPVFVDTGILIQSFLQMPRFWKGENNLPELSNWSVLDQKLNILSNDVSKVYSSPVSTNGTNCNITIPGFELDDFINCSPIANDSLACVCPSFIRLASPQGKRYMRAVKSVGNPDEYCQPISDDEYEVAHETSVAVGLWMFWVFYGLIPFISFARRTFHSRNLFTALKCVIGPGIKKDGLEDQLAANNLDEFDHVLFLMHMWITFSHVIYEPHRCQQDLLSSLEFNPSPLKLQPSFFNLIQWPLLFVKMVLALCSFFPTYFLTRQYVIQDGAKDWLELPFYQQLFRFLKHYILNNIYGIWSLAMISAYLIDGNIALQWMSYILSWFFMVLALCAQCYPEKLHPFRCCRRQMCYPSSLWHQRRSKARKSAVWRIKTIDMIWKKFVGDPTETLNRYNLLRQQAPYLFDEEISINGGRPYHFVKFHEENEATLIERYYPAIVRASLESTLDQWNMDFPTTIFDETMEFLPGFDSSDMKSIISDPSTVSLDAFDYNGICTRDVVEFSDDESIELGIYPKASSEESKDVKLQQVTSSFGG